MKIKSILKLGTLALLTAALPACSFLDTDPQIIPDDGYYNSEQKLIYGLAGVYGVLNSEALYGNYYSLQIANADDLCYFNNYNNSESRPDRYNHSAGTAAIYDTWSKLYEGIKNANRYIEAVEKTEIDPGKLSVDIGLYIAEARFLRAYYHFLLAQAWGDVPLRVKATTSPNPNDVQMAAGAQMVRRRDRSHDSRPLRAHRQHPLARQPDRRPGHSGPRLSLHGRRERQADRRTG